MNICKISWDRAAKISMFKKLNENSPMESILNTSGRPFSANCKTSLTLVMEILRSTRKSTFLLTQRHYINLLIDYPFGIKTKEQFDIENAK